MSVQVWVSQLLQVVCLPQIHVVVPMLPSSSVRVAVMAVPMTGVSGDRVMTPGSLALVTVMVTATLS